MKYIIEVIAEKIVHGVVFGLVFLLPAVAIAVPSVSIPTQVNVGFVTCIPNTTGAAGCLNNSAATSAQWRVINNFASPTDFLDATLTFDYTGGELVWSWDVIHPTTGPGSFVETPSFPIGFMRIESAVTVAWALTYSPPCPLKLNPAPGSKEQILCLPMPHSHLECGRLFAGGRGQNALKFPSPDMKWHTRLRKSIVRLGHNPPSERRQTPFSQLRR